MWGKRKIEMSIFSVSFFNFRFLHYLCLKSDLQKSGMMVHTGNPNTKEAETGESQVLAHPGQLGKFKVSLYYRIRPSQKKIK